MRPGLQILTGTLVFACGALPGALAADPPRFDVTPMVGYRMGGEFEVVDPEATSGTSIDLDEGTSFGIDLGLYRDSNSFYELLYSRQESGFDSPDASIGSVDLATEYLHFGGTLLFPDEYWYVPWISLTVGATRLPVIRLKPRPMAAANGANGRRLDMRVSPTNQKGASPWMVVRYNLRRR